MRRALEQGDVVESEDAERYVCESTDCSPLAHIFVATWWARDAAVRRLSARSARVERRPIVRIAAQ
jgi:hypothetical protein